MASEKTAEHAHVEQVHTDKVAENPIYGFTLAGTKFLKATKGHVVARLPLGANQMNSHRSLHGSVSATIIDWMGGLAISSYDLRHGSGVSVDIHIIYQSRAKAGEEIEIEGIAEKVGGSLAFTKVNIFKVEDGVRGKVVASGTHTKFVKGSEPAKKP